MRLLAIREQPLLKLNGTHHLSANTASARRKGHPDELDLQTLRPELRDIRVLRIDAAGVIQFDASYFVAIL